MVEDYVVGIKQNEANKEKIKKIATAKFPLHHKLSKHVLVAFHWGECKTLKLFKKQLSYLFLPMVGIID